MSEIGVYHFSPFVFPLCSQVCILHLFVSLHHHICMQYRIYTCTFMDLTVLGMMLSGSALHLLCSVYVPHIPTISIPGVSCTDSVSLCVPFTYPYPCYLARILCPYMRTIQGSRLHTGFFCTHAYPCTFLSFLGPWSVFTQGDRTIELSRTE